MWMLDAGGYRQLKCWLAALPLFFGYFMLYRALTTFGRGRAGFLSFGRTGLASSALGLGLVAWSVPARLLPLLRVDVLQALRSE